MFDVYNDDCIKILNKLEDSSIDCVVTDPPYKVTPHGTTSGLGGIFKSPTNKEERFLDTRLFQHNDIEPSEYAPEFYRVLKEGTHCYIMTNNLNLQDMLNAFTFAGFHFIKLLVWHKDNKICNQFYMQSLEFILFLRKGKFRPINNFSDTDYSYFPNNKTKDGKNGVLHPTEKPVELMKKFVGNSTKENDVVLDPFLGIGATALACKELNRQFIGCEIDRKFYDIALNRLENGVYTETLKDSIFDL